MFKRLSNEPGGDVIMFSYNGQLLEASAGDSVASALLLAGVTTWRLTPQGEQRGPFCMMGACYDCLVEIDGETVQACMTPVTDGLVVTSAVPPGIES